ncbi:hypothetical protein [Sporosarcina sp. FSL K6-1508]|uniref:hypothetical protein n=1 Tax=Sporosarcina sp. FSL K6-1508 TaxID=2921553 RepID=UPI0030FC74C9
MTLDLSEAALQNGKGKSSNALLLDVITAQEDLLNAKNAAMISLLNENVEQEALIDELLKDHID